MDMRITEDSYQPLSRLLCDPGMQELGCLLTVLGGEGVDPPACGFPGVLSCVCVKHVHVVLSSRALLRGYPI
jgi:hypothetical protein